MDTGNLFRRNPHPLIKNYLTAEIQHYRLLSRHPQRMFILGEWLQ
mgnify:FL=1|jgi:hypothetical protein